MNLLFVKIYRELASRKCLQTTGVANCSVAQGGRTENGRLGN
ncbi:hypothetical protein [Bacillus mycoides]